MNFSNATCATLDQFGIFYLLDNTTAARAAIGLPKVQLNPDIVVVNAQQIALLMAEKLRRIELRFFKQSLAIGNRGVRMARLTLERSPNQSLRILARGVASLSEKITGEIAQLACAHGCDVGQLAPETEVNPLAAVPAGNFDESYLEFLITDCENLVTLFEDVARGMQDPGVRSFAAKYLPALHEQLSQVEKLRCEITT
ncbi:DUF4142 domain-containing protein [Oleiharenicola lentus]|uniref:DUF4142 domain-containing protein n=1 Tax=Oleiharenicola lentus TaxID=2508720 RepID=UPI003F6746B0